MKRREFITLCGGAAVAWPLTARAQQASMPVIGFLHSGKPDAYTHALAGLRQGLREAGYVEGQNVVIEFRWANYQRERLPELAADLARRQVAVIISGGGPPSALAAKAATSTIPVVLAFGSDPVKLRLVASLNHPGGNITGVTFITAELMGKRLGLLCELVPHARTVAYLYRQRPTAITELAAYGEQTTRDILVAAATLGRQVVVLTVDSERDFEPAFATLVDRQAGALVVGPYSIFTDNRDKLVALAARHKIPAIYPDREFVTAGGLMSYAADFVDAFRQAGLYVGRILKGAKPADLPFQQSTRFQLAINLKTAKTLGLVIPPTLLASTDEVIE